MGRGGELVFSSEIKPCKKKVCADDEELKKVYSLPKKIPCNLDLTRLLEAYETS